MTDDLKKPQTKRRELYAGWLSPTGEFLKAGLYEHISIAREVAKKLHLPDYDFRTERRISADTALENAGWVYIGIGTFMDYEWRIGGGMIPWTPEQKAFLRQYFEESDIPVNQVSRDRWELENG